MNRKFVLAVSIIISFNLFSQNIDIKWGNREDFGRDATAPEFLGQLNDELFILKGSNIDKVEDYFIEIHSKSSLVATRRILFTPNKLPTIGKDALERIIFNRENKLFTIISSSISSKVTTIKASIISTSGDILSEGTIIGSYSDKGMKNKGAYDIINQGDNFIIFELLPTEKKGFEKYRYTIFDIDMNKKGTKEITLPYEDREFGLNNFYFNSKNSLYILGHLKTRKTNIEKELLLYFDFNTNDVTEIDLPLPAKNVTQYKLNLNSDDNFEFFGIYSDLMSESSYYNTVYPEGLFYMKFEPQSGKILFLNKCPIKTNKLSIDERKIFSDEGYLPNSFKLNEVFSPHPDTLIYVTEDTYDYEFNNRGTITQTNERKHNIIFKTDLKGNLVSTSIVPKYQRMSMVESTYIFYVPVSYVKRNYKFRKVLSYLSLFNDNKLFLFYNDNSENLENKKIYKPKKAKFSKETAFMLAIINRDGIVERKLILDKSDDSYLITPMNSVLLSETEILFFSISKRDRANRMGIMNFEVK